ncbi:MAG: hypothetical protein ACREPI_11080 [Candidatus Dormibacterales bacterium]
MTGLTLFWRCFVQFALAMTETMRLGEALDAHRLALASALWETHVHLADHASVRTRPALESPILL